MTDNYKIVPYQTQHGDEMIEFGLNDTLMDGDATFKENRIDFAKTSPLGGGRPGRLKRKKIKSGGGGGAGEDAE